MGLAENVWKLTLQFSVKDDVAMWSTTPPLLEYSLKKVASDSGWLQQSEITCTSVQRDIPSETLRDLQCGRRVR